jgi:hypothetical protein
VIARWRIRVLGQPDYLGFLGNLRSPPNREVDPLQNCRASTQAAATASLTRSMIRRSSSASEQSEQAPQQTNTAWRSGVARVPILLGGEAGSPHNRQTGDGTVALSGSMALSGNRSEIGSKRRTTMEVMRLVLGSIQFDPRWRTPSTRDSLPPPSKLITPSGRAPTRFRRFSLRRQYSRNGRRCLIFLASTRMCAAYLVGKFEPGSKR